MTETDWEKDMFGDESLFHRVLCLIKTWLHTWQEREREADLWLNLPNVLTIQKCLHSEQIPLWLSFTPVQLIGLILASVSLKAWCICPTETPKGRKDNTSKPAAQLLADFKEILGDCAPPRCLFPCHSEGYTCHSDHSFVYVVGFSSFKAVWCPVVRPSPLDHRHV